MRRRDETEKTLSQLDVIRGALQDPATGLSALYLTLDQTRQKVLEAVAQGTMGLREENRELRRRQERMLTDLAETRGSLEALSRRLEETSQAEPPVQPPVTSLPAVGAPAIVEPAEQQTAGLGPAAPEIDEPAEATEESDGKEPQVDLLEEVRTAHGQGTAMTRKAAELQSPTQEPARISQEDQRAHLERLLSAASIASATLICHRETWDFIAEQTSGHAHFRLPERIDDADSGRIETALSGRSLLALLTTMWKVTRGHEAGGAPGEDQDLATWALAAAVYRRTALAVERVTDQAEKENGPALIILDDRSTRTVPPDPGNAAA
ncbi:hypothetical protein WDV06_33670 [Streptomyces racemochromogenes]|uniref:Uncharacterized protein n=1 Tax=Streptomyces racemochromogenes TaxID=67353 RepID=A0ABW7PQS3_9ACTN